MKPKSGKTGRKIPAGIPPRDSSGGTLCVRDVVPSAPPRGYRVPRALASGEPAQERERLRDAMERISREMGLVEAGRLLVEVFDEQASRLREPEPQAGLTGAVLRGRLAREELKLEEGGSVSSAEAAERLGISKQAVLKRFHLGQLLGWREAKQGAVRMPVWQFVEDNVLPGVPETLAVLQRAPWMDDWARMLFFLNRRASLQGQRPLDRLRSGDREGVLQAAWDGIQ